MCLIFFKFIFDRERERKREREGGRESEHEWGRSRERGRHRIIKQAPGSEMSAQSPMYGSNPQTMRSWPEPKLEA